MISQTPMTADLDLLAGRAWIYAAAEIFIMTTASAAELDQLLTALIQSAEGISDLLFITGKPPLAEIHGRLLPPKPARAIAVIR
jgi:hypothetical protein